MRISIYLGLVMTAALITHAAATLGAPPPLALGMTGLEQAFRMGWLGGILTIAGLCRRTICGTCPD